MSASSPAHLPSITVAVCTRNRAEGLREAVASLAKLRTEGLFRFEVLVIDNGSSDHTARVARELDASLPIDVRYVFEARPGVAIARNRAIEECPSDWLAFFDDDQLADPLWLLRLLELAERRRTPVVGGKVELALPEGCRRDLHPHVRMLLGGSVGMERERAYSVSVTPGAGNLMVRRSLFDEVGRFDPRLNGRGEDTELYLRCHAAGHRGWYSPAAIIHHVIPAERLQDAFLLRLSERMAEGMAEDEQAGRGAGLFPFVYAARLAQAGLILWPRLQWARLGRRPEAVLGARCRLRIAQRYLADGWALLRRPGTAERTPAGLAT